MNASDAETSVQTSQAVSADQQPQASSQPQRSRTTVVCGECKRLKLKCDRQQPCGSCLKRDIVGKCLYSAAAVEKLDIHSVNIRLGHVETYTATYTNGRFQPAYASANPSSQAVHSYASQSIQQHPGCYYHQHHHHTAVSYHNMMPEAFSKSFQKLVPTCLGDLAIIHNPTSSPQDDIKLEPSLIDNAISLERRFGPSLDAPFSSSRRMSKFQLRQLLHRHHTEAEPMLPPMSVYYSASQNNVPQVTSALLSCLPPLATCQRLLQSAGDVFRVRPLPFDPSGRGWKHLEKRCLQFLSHSGKDRATAKRAREIYFAGTSQPPVNGSASLDVGRGVGYRVNSPNDGDGSHRSSLSFFAITCAVLAVGAVSSASEGDIALMPSSSAFFYDLCQQALGVWDTHVSSSPSKRSTKDDAEQIEYLLACLISVVYLLQSGTIVAASPDKAGDGVQEEEAALGEELQDEVAEIVSSLVGKMVTVARNTHLDRETTWTKRKRKKSSNRDHFRDEWKRMLWWEIVFYDLFIADALGQQPCISLSPYGTNFPSCAIFSQPTKTGPETTMLEDVPCSVDQGHGVRNAAPGPHHDPLITGNVETPYEYFGARYQLARVAHAVKSRNSLPDCCCGYTLDQAVALQNQVQEWQESLPASLKISGDDESGSTTAPSIPTASQVESTLSRLRAYELAIIANVLVVNIYIPFLRADRDDGVRSCFKNLPATSACIHAAQTIIHLADGLRSVLSGLSLVSPRVIPMMFEFIPLEKLVFDAVVVCAHSAFAVKSPSMAFMTAPMADGASLGLEVLHQLGSPSFSVIYRDGDEEFQTRVMNVLHALLVQRKTGLKRKHSEKIADPSLNPPVSGRSGANHTLEYPMHQVSGPPTHHTFIMDALSSPSSTLESDSVSQSPSSERHPSNVRQKSSNQGKVKKGKKLKGEAEEKEHPMLGLRIRDSSSKVRVAPPSGADDPWLLGEELQMQPGQLSTTFSPSKAAEIISTFSPIDTSSSSVAGPCLRSRSSSTSFVHPQPVDLMRFETPMSQTPDELGMPPRKRPTLQDIRDPPFQPQSVAFLSHAFDQSHRQTQRDPSYDQVMLPTTFGGQCAPAGTMDPLAYATHPYPMSDQMPSTFFTSPTSYRPAFAESPPSNGGPHSDNMGLQPLMMSDQTRPAYGQPVNSYAPLQQHQIQNHPMASNTYHPASGQPLGCIPPTWVNPPCQGW